MNVHESLNKNKRDWASAFTNSGRLAPPMNPNPGVRRLDPNPNSGTEDPGPKLCPLLHFSTSPLQVSISVTLICLQFSCSVTQLCPTLRDPINHSTPGLPVHHQLPEFTQTHVHRVGDAIQPSHPLSSPSPPAPNPSQHKGLSQWANSLHEVAKVLEFQLQHQSFQCLNMSQFPFKTKV